MPKSLNIYIDIRKKFHHRCLTMSYPLDTRRKLNVHKTFRRRPFLYPLKMSENLWFSDVFGGYTNERLLNISSRLNLRIVSRG